MKNKQSMIDGMNPDFELLSDYIGIREDITRKCKVCGDIRTVKARALIEKDKNGNFRECIVCRANERAKTLRKTNGQFVEEMKHINPNIEFLSEYTTNDTKIKCKCIIDGYEWMGKPHSLLQGHGCPECSHRNQGWYSTEKIKQFQKENPTIKILNEFHRTKDILNFKCDVCNYEWSTSANAVINNNKFCGCPKCNRVAPVSEQEMIDRLHKNNSRVEYVSGYAKLLSHATFRCVDCGNIWSTPANSVLQGRGCPKCNKSKGELKIANSLDNIGVKYEEQYSFDDCRYIRPLPFDFYIESHNIAVEFDGIQHFEPIRFDKHNKKGTPQERFKELQKRDNIKTNYCKDNNITLIRIPYTDFDDIEDILNKYLA